MFLGLGRSAVLPEISGPEMKELAGVLKTPGDIRQGQLIKNYDQFYYFIKELIVKYQIASLNYLLQMRLTELL